MVDTIEEVFSKQIVSTLVKFVQEKLGTEGYNELIQKTNDKFPRPVRYEDVEYYADKITHKVISSPELFNSLRVAVVIILRNSMRPE